ncbi:MAG TPA: hypothetical protein VGK48_02685 [Terriglobia bacterium]|jgi:hypothetical protein
MLAIVVLPQTGAAQRFVVRPHAAYGFGFGWGPAFYSPYYYSGYYPGYYPAAGIYGVSPHGDVKIETHLKDASIYVDGGFAGSSGKLKHFPLQTGNHDIEVRNSAGQTLFHDKVQVLPGRTVDIKL